MAINFSNEQHRIAEINAYGKFYPNRNKSFFFKLVRKIFIEFYLIKVNISNFFRGILFKVIPIKKKRINKL